MAALTNKNLSVDRLISLLFGNHTFDEFQSILDEKEDAKSLINISSTKSGDCLAHAAARHGKIDVLKLLNQHGADFEAGNLDGKRPLHEAAASSSLASVKFLLSLNVTIDSLKRADWTPLMLACTKKSIEVIKVLVEAGANLHLKNKDGWTCFHIASREGDADILSYLLECDNSLYQTVSNNGRTPLHTAALHGRHDACQILLNHCSVDVQDSCGSTPLMDAARAGFPEIVDDLINIHQADARKCDILGRQAIHLASLAGSVNVIQYLVTKQGIDVNIPSQPNALTPLHFAAKEGKADAMTYLIQEGANVNVQDTNCRTALHMAAGSQDVQSIRYLLENGALQLFDKNSIKPDMLARTKPARMMFDQIT
ncbi:ankyrin repeat domain-containing protein 16-like [Antedon mediterranea]|uniref:ankyrin repeat domain-containing protein 16-like n=1 Tax=Antedon mediterranea TaxID=105859 RepID=UPI003AF59D85